MSKTTNKYFPEVRERAVRMVLVLCRELDLFGYDLVAVDGTAIKAVNSDKQNFAKAKLAKAMADS